MLNSIVKLLNYCQRIIVFRMNVQSTKSRCQETNHKSLKKYDPSYKVPAGKK